MVREVFGAIGGLSEDSEREEVLAARECRCLYKNRASYRYRDGHTKRKYGACFRNLGKAKGAR